MRAACQDRWYAVGRQTISSLPIYRVLRRTWWASPGRDLGRSVAGGTDPVPRLQVDEMHLVPDDAQTTLLGAGWAQMEGVLWP